MGKSWLRVNTDWRRHPRVRKLGWFGATVLQQVWIIAKEHGRDGFVSSTYLEAGYIAGEMFLDDPQRVAMIPSLLALACAAGLLVEEEGGLRVHDWAQYQLDGTSTERSRRFRDRGNAVQRRATEGTAPVPSRPVLSSSPNSNSKSNGRANSQDSDRDDQHERDAREFKGRFTPDEHRVWVAFEAMCADAALRAPSRTMRHVKRLRAALKRHGPDDLVAGLKAFSSHADDTFKGGGTWGTNATPEILFREHNVERLLGWANEGKRSNGGARQPTAAELAEMTPNERRLFGFDKEPK